MYTCNGSVSPGVCRGSNHSYKSCVLSCYESVPWKGITLLASQLDTSTLIHWVTSKMDGIIHSCISVDIYAHIILFYSVVLLIAHVYHTYCIWNKTFGK